MFQHNGSHGATKIYFVFVKFVAESMGNNSHQVSSLSQSCVDLFPWHINKIVEFAQSKSWNGAEVIQSWNMEGLIYEVRFLELCISSLEVLQVRVYLFLFVKLSLQLHLIIIDLRPHLLIIHHDPILILTFLS